MSPLFQKRLKTPHEFTLNEENFFDMVKLEPKDVAASYSVIAYANHYNLLYRNGKFLSMPCPNGGAIYPFSPNPTKKCGRSAMRKYTQAMVVCLAKDFIFQVPWGTKNPFDIKDPVTGKPYKIGGHGTFYVKIDPSDAGFNADRFYTQCIAHREKVTVEVVRNVLSAAINNQIGAKIQEYIESQGQTLASYVALQAGDMLNISHELCESMEEVFNVFGLTVIPELSKHSILETLLVREFETV